VKKELEFLSRLTLLLNDIPVWFNIDFHKYYHTKIENVIPLPVFVCRPWPLHGAVRHFDMS